MTELPITLGAKEYRTYLAARTRSTNQINDNLIETLRLNASLFVEPKTRMLTTVDSDIVDYVNRNEVALERIKTIRKKRRSRRPTPSPPPLHVVKFSEGVLIDIMQQLRLPFVRVVVLWSYRSSRSSSAHHPHSWQ
jgi:hypothetical protein